MDTPEIAGTWRAELVAEDEELASRLTEALTALEAAAAKLENAQINSATLLKFATDFLRPGESLASPLRRRLIDAKAAQTAASGAHARAAGLVDVIRTRQASVRESIDQIDRAIARERVATTRLPEVVRHIPPPVEFDNVILPAGAAS